MVGVAVGVDCVYPAGIFLISEVCVGVGVRVGQRVFVGVGVRESQGVREGVTVRVGVSVGGGGLVGEGIGVVVFNASRGYICSMADNQSSPAVLANWSNLAAENASFQVERAGNLSHP